LYLNIDEDAISIGSNSDDEILSDKENDVLVDQNPEIYTIIPGVQVGSLVYVDNLNFRYLVCHRKNHNDWPFNPASASVKLNNPGNLSLNRLHDHHPEIINKPLAFIKEAVSKRVLSPGNLSSSVRLVYNQEIVNHPEVAEHYTYFSKVNLIVNGNQVGVVFANTETIERYRAELGTVVVAGFDSTFKTVPKSPPEHKKGTFFTFQIVYRSVVLALPHLPAHRGHPDRPRHDINDEKLNLIKNQCYVELHHAQQNYTRQERFIITQTICQHIRILNVDGDILMFLRRAGHQNDGYVHCTRTDWSTPSRAQNGYGTAAAVTDIGSTTTTLARILLSAITATISNLTETSCAHAIEP
ncbi:Uncharacterized protein FWK35_00005774, partial [Aphis craccivora]